MCHELHSLVEVVDYFCFKIASFLIFSILVYLNRHPYCIYEDYWLTLYFV